MEGGPLFVSLLRSLENSGKDLKIELKSLVGRSLRYTLNSGAVWKAFLLVPWTASMISFMIDKVLGPDEQPRSAMPKLFGAVVR